MSLKIFEALNVPYVLVDDIPLAYPGDHMHPDHEFILQELRKIGYCSNGAHAELASPQTVKATSGVAACFSHIEAEGVYEYNEEMPRLQLMWSKGNDSALQFWLCIICDENKYVEEIGQAQKNQKKAGTTETLTGAQEFDLWRRGKLGKMVAVNDIRCIDEDGRILDGDNHDIHAVIPANEDLIRAFDMLEHAGFGLMTYSRYHESEYLFKKDREIIGIMTSLLSGEWLVERMMFDDPQEQEYLGLRSKGAQTLGDFLRTFHTRNFAPPSPPDSSANPTP